MNDHDRNARSWGSRFSDGAPLRAFARDNLLAWLFVVACCIAVIVLDSIATHWR